MDTATAEPPAQTQHKPKRGALTPLPIDRQAVKLASIAGIEDEDLANQFPGLQRATIRKWRERDKEWSTAYYAARRAQTGGRTPKHLQRPHTTPEALATKKAASLSVTSAILTDSIASIAGRNRIRLANEVDRAMAKREKSKQPLPIGTFAELNQAARALLYAEGRDAEAPAIQLNVWGNPGLQAQQQTGGFRDLPANGTETNGDAS